MANQLEKIEKIKASYDDPSIKLNEKEQEIKNRWRMALAYMLEGRTASETAKHLHDTMGVSLSMGFKDVQIATSFYGNVIEVDRRVTSAVIEQKLWKEYRELKEARSHLTEEKAIIDSYKVAAKILESMAKILPKEKDQLFDPDKYKGHNYHVVLDKYSEELIQNGIKGGSLNLNFQAEDTSFVEKLKQKEVNEAN